MADSNGYTGHLFEEEVLGTCRVEWHGYLNFVTSLEMVRKNQPSEQKSRARNLRVHVARALGVPMIEVKLLTAVGTPLDIYHGVDGVFEFCGSVVTIDLTLNPSKDSYKADVILGTQEIEHPEVAAATIAHLFSEKLSRRCA